MSFVIVDSEYPTTLFGLNREAHLNEVKFRQSIYLKWCLTYAEWFGALTYCVRLLNNTSIHFRLCDLLARNQELPLEQSIIQDFETFSVTMIPKLEKLINQRLNFGGESELNLWTSLKKHPAALCTQPLDFGRPNYRENHHLSSSCYIKRVQ